MRSRGSPGDVATTTLGVSVRSLVKKILRDVVSQDTNVLCIKFSTHGHRVRIRVAGSYRRGLAEKPT